MSINRIIFEKCVNFFTKNKAARYTLHCIYKALPLLLFAAYPSLLVYSFFALKSDLLRLTLVPLGVYIAVAIIRMVVNENRPYEKYGKPSVFHKNTNGKSFPSRHTASAFIIAMAFLYVNVPLGIVVLVISVLIAVSRVLAGAHYVHDVLSGMAIGILCGWLFFFLI